MKNINRILFPTDFSSTASHAFRYAVQMAIKLNASIEILHVLVPDYDSAELPVSVAFALKGRVENMKIQLEAFVKNALGETRFMGASLPEITTEIDIGNISSRIILHAKSTDAELIIMGTKGEHPVFERLFGSTSSLVGQKAHCPVLLVPEEAELDKVITVAFATDLVAEDPYHIWKVGKLLEVFHPILRCIHVHKADEEKHELDLGDLEDFFENNPPALQLSFHEVRGGSVVDRLSEFAETWDVDLLVMYAPHRSLFERFFHKSQTQRMAFHTKVPLLILKDLT